MNNEHPITPPLELWQKFWDEAEGENAQLWDYHVAIKVSRWAADQELEACCEWLETGPYGFSIEATAPSMTKRLRAARRPKPPSLKEQALEQLKAVDSDLRKRGIINTDIIRQALELLPDEAT